MHRHLHLVVARPKPEHQRPAKVIQIEARRQARLDAIRPIDPQRRPAA